MKKQYEDALKEIEKFETEGCTHIMAAMDDDGNVIGDVELIKDSEHDMQLKKRHGSEGVVVIER